MDEILMHSIRVSIREAPESTKHFKQYLRPGSSYFLWNQKTPK